MRLNILSLSIPLLPYFLQASAHPHTKDAVHSVYLFPENRKAENLAVRSQGHVLVTSTKPAPNLYLFHPQSNHNHTPPLLVTSFPEATSAIGITELAHDIFYVATGNITSNGGPAIAGTPGSFALYEVDMNPFRPTANRTAILHDAHIRKVASLPKASLLNGVTSIYSAHEPPKDFVLIADTLAGIVWNVDVRTGAVSVAFTDKTHSGINGVKVHDGFLYWTGTVTNTLNRVPINTRTGLVDSAARMEIVATEVTCDDFVFDRRGRAFVAGSVDNVVWMVEPATGKKQVVAGTLNSTESALRTPSAVEFGRGKGEEDVLFVTTTGGMGNITLGTQGLSRFWAGVEGETVMH